LIVVGVIPGALAVLPDAPVVGELADVGLVLVPGEAVVGELDLDELLHAARTRHDTAANKTGALHFRFKFFLP
jgi:hypothetical protein